MQQGFTLIEVLIAIIILLVGVVGVFSLIVSSISASSDSVDNFTASQLAAEGIEIVRNLRDQNWLNLAEWTFGLSVCQAGCERDYNDLVFSPYGNNFLKIDSNGFYNYQTGQSSKFKRMITIMPKTDYLEVKVKVMWQNKSFTVIDNLYNWLSY